MLYLKNNNLIFTVLLIIIFFYNIYNNTQYINVNTLHILKRYIQFLADTFDPMIMHFFTYYIWNLYQMYCIRHANHVYWYDVRHTSCGSYGNCDIKHVDLLEHMQMWRCVFVLLIRKEEEEEDDVAECWSDRVGDCGHADMCPPLHALR